MRIHKSLCVTPAMAVGLSDAVWGMDDLTPTLDEHAPKLGPRGSCKKWGSD